ncbi:MAG: hypothetical protein ACJ79K_14130 [Gemmatimonadaceae bacterium]
MMSRYSARLVFTAIVVGAAACADSTAPSAQLTNLQIVRDVASDAADATAQDIGEMVGTEVAVGLPMASSPAAGVPAGCAWSAASSRFVCATITNADGLRLDRSFAFYAGGSAQQSYDATATDSINFQGALEGTLVGAARTAWLKTNRTMTVSGLAGAETQRSWTGTGTRTDSMQVNDDVSRRTRIHSVDQVSAVVFALPRSTNPWPKSGTITHDIEVSSTADNGAGTRSRSATRHVVVTFNGTQFAAVLIGTTPCTLDLAARHMSCGGAIDHVQ